MKKTLTAVDAASLIIGIVIGVGIFKAPSLVALHTGNAILFFAVWLAGGAISLIGALCYAELAAAYPHPGGDYHYLLLALGKKPAFLFAWARMTVMQTGSIAMLAFYTGRLPVTGSAPGDIFLIHICRGQHHCLDRR